MEITELRFANLDGEPPSPMITVELIAQWLPPKNPDRVLVIWQVKDPNVTHGHFVDARLYVSAGNLRDHAESRNFRSQATRWHPTNWPGQQVLIVPYITRAKQLIVKLLHLTVTSP